MAPGMLPMPPSTAATNALRPVIKPISGSMRGMDSATSTPPTAASAEPSAKVNAMTKSVLIPIRRATGRLNDTARIAFPIFVRWTMNSRPNIRMTANDDDHQALIGDLHTAERVGLRADHLRKEPRRGAEDDLPAVFEQQRDADRGDQRRQPRVMTNRPVREPLDEHADQRADRHRADRDDESPRAPTGWRPC